jgi:hypothetical protein
MITVRAHWPMLAVLFFSSCCHVNRLPGRSQEIKTVSYEVSVRERPTVRFTSRRSLEIRPGMRPSGFWEHTEAELEQSLASIEGEDFSALVLKQAAGVLGAEQGWAFDESGDGADALLQIRVENICCCAPDMLSELDVKLMLKAVLTRSADGEVLWRDCLDWTFRGFDQSLQQLGQADASRREELLSDLAARMLKRLAKHISAQRQTGG